MVRKTQIGLGLSFGLVYFCKDVTTPIHILALYM